MLLQDTQFVPHLQERLKRATKRNKCVICGGTGCGFTSYMALCWRIRSSEQAKSGAYIHFLNNNFTTSAPMSKSIEEPKAPAETISKVYESLLDCLVLSDKHTKDLEARGLSPMAIVKNRYRTIPTREDARIVCKYLEDLYSLEGIPGFYMEDVRRLNIKGSGIFIPYRDPDRIIRAMQVRPDRG